MTGNLPFTLPTNAARWRPTRPPRKRATKGTHVRRSKIPLLLLRLSLGTLFIGMISALVVMRTSVEAGEGPESGMAVVLGLSVALTFALDAWGMKLAPGEGNLVALVAAFTLSGIPGLLLYPSNRVLMGAEFCVLLAIRNYICFVGVPLSRIAAERPVERDVIGLALSATTAVAVGALALATRMGISFSSVARLTGEGNAWLNANTTGLYCAFGVVVCTMAAYLPKWIRIPAGCLAMYCVVLTHSRTALVALFVTLGVHLSIVYARRKAIGIYVAAVGLVLGVYSQTMLVATIESVPQLRSFASRFQDVDVTEYETRLDRAREGAGFVAGSPIVGRGYMAVGVRFEQAYLSIAAESGLLGLSFYIWLMTLVLFNGLRLLRRRGDPRARELGHYLVCTTTFILVHGLAEHSHGFQIASPVSNCWALLAGIAATFQPGAPHMGRVAVAGRTLKRCVGAAGHWGASTGQPEGTNRRVPGQSGQGKDDATVIGPAPCS